MNLTALRIAVCDSYLLAWASAVTAKLKMRMTISFFIFPGLTYVVPVGP